MNQTSEVLPAPEREAIRQRRIRRVVDAVGYAATATGSVIAFPLVIHYGLTVGTIAEIVVTFGLWSGTFLNLLDVGPQ